MRTKYEPDYPVALLLVFSLAWSATFIFLSFGAGAPGMFFWAGSDYLVEVCLVSPLRVDHWKRSGWFRIKDEVIRILGQIFGWFRRDLANYGGPIPTRFLALLTSSSGKMISDWWGRALR